MESLKYNFSPPFREIVPTFREVKSRNFLAGGLLLVFLILSCTNEQVATPKPKGYFRINFPEKNYQRFGGNAPYAFDYPTYARLLSDSSKNAGKYWKNLIFDQFNGTLQITYYGDFNLQKYNTLTEDARSLAMKHTIRANAIDQKLISYPQHKVYGVYYAIDGNTASSVQFFLTDSSKHYLRGALYFNERPQYDSLQPVINFIKKDIDRMIESFKWKNEVGSLP